MSLIHDPAAFILPASPLDCPWFLGSWADRFELRPAPQPRVLNRTLEGPCWIWRGWDNGKGYGVVRVGGRRMYLHRYAFMQFYGVEIGPEHVIDHLCRDRGCFNPKHHEAVTYFENYQRGDGPAYQFKPASAYPAAPELSQEDIDALTGSW